MLFIDRGREKGKFSSIFLMTWPGLCNESCGTGTFSCFFKGYQEAWHSYFREKFECNTETSVIWQHSCLSLECHIRGLTVPLTLSALLADFSWCLLGFFPFGSVPTSLSLTTVDSLFRSAFLADFALSLPPFPKNLLPQNSCKIDKVFPSGRHTLGDMAQGPSQWNEDEQTGTISLMWHILLWGQLYQKCLRQVANKHCPFNEKVERFVNKPLGHLFLVYTAVKKREQNSILKKAGPNKLQNQTNARTTSPNLK